MKWLDNMSYVPLILIALLLGIAPYPSQPQPHLIEKLSMLLNGTLVKPIDIFDLFLHAAPIILLAIKLTRDKFMKKAGV